MECSICLTEIQEEHKVTLDCQHVFDRNCFQRWTKNKEYSSCPLCRSIIPNNPDIIQSYISFAILEWHLETPRTPSQTKQLRLFQWNGQKAFPLDTSSLTAIRYQRRLLQEKGIHKNLFAISQIFKALKRQIP